MALWHSPARPIVDLDHNSLPSPRFIGRLSSTYGGKNNDIHART